MALVVDSAFSPSVLQVYGIFHSQVVLQKVTRLPVDCEGLYADIFALQIARLYQHDEDADVLNLKETACGR